MNKKVLPATTEGYGLSFGFRKCCPSKDTVPQALAPDWDCSRHTVMNPYHSDQRAGLLSGLNDTILGTVTLPEGKAGR